MYTPSITMISNTRRKIIGTKLRQNKNIWMDGLIDRFVDNLLLNDISKQKITYLLQEVGEKDGLIVFHLPLFTT